MIISFQVSYAGIPESANLLSDTRMHSSRMYRPHFTVRGGETGQRPPLLPLPPREQNDFVAGGKTVCQTA